MTSRAVDLAPLFADWLRGRALLPSALLRFLGARAREQFSAIHPGAVTVAVMSTATGRVAVATSKSTHLAFAWAPGATPATAVKALRPRLGKARQDTAERGAIDWLAATAETWTTASRDDEIALRCLARAYMIPISRFEKTAAMFHGWADRPWTAEELLVALLPEEPETAAAPTGNVANVPTEPEPSIQPGLVAITDVERVLGKIREEALVTTLRWARLHAATRGRLLARDAAARLWKRSATVLRDRWLQALRERAAVDAALARVTEERDEAWAHITKDEKARAGLEGKIEALRAELDELRIAPRKRAGAPHAAERHAETLAATPVPTTPKPARATAAPLRRVQVPRAAGAPAVVTARGPEPVPVNDGGLATETTPAEVAPKRAAPLLSPEEAHHKLQDRLREERERKRLRSGFYDKARPDPFKDPPDESEEDEGTEPEDDEESEDE